MTTAIFCLIALRSDDIPRFGKSDQQILALGREAYTTYYKSKNGDNRESEWNSDELYLRAIRARNDRLLRSAKGEAAKAKILRPKLYDLFVRLMKIGTSIQPGGYWRGADHDQGIGIETAIYGIAMRKPFNGIVYVSAFGRPLSTIEKNMEASRKEGQEIDTVAFAKQMSDVRARYGTIVGIAKSLPTAGSSWTLGYCRDLAAWVAEGYAP